VKSWNPTLAKAEIESGGMPLLRLAWKLHDGTMVETLLSVAITGVRFVNHFGRADTKLDLDIQQLGASFTPPPAPACWCGPDPRDGDR
jgi:hypothetical protein